MAHRVSRARGRRARLIRRALVAVAFVALVAGCGGGGHRQTTTTRPVTHPKPPPATTRAHHTSARPAKLVVTILDGDLRERVPRAHVRLAGKTGTTDRHGVTVIAAGVGGGTLTAAAGTPVVLDAQPARQRASDTLRTVPATLVSFSGDAYAFITDTFRMPVITMSSVRTAPSWSATSC